MSGMKTYLAAAAIAAMPFVGAGSASAVDLGYGDLVGTWCQGGQGGCPYDNPNGDGSNAAVIGQYILDVLDPDPFVISDFNVGGTTLGGWAGGNLSDGTDGSGFEIFKTDGLNGTWEYHGVNGRPDDEPVDLYLTVKYGNDFSIFFYGPVYKDDTGSFTASYTTYGVDPCPLGYFFGADCMAAKYSGNPKTATGTNGISHVVAFWPPADGTDVPEPATLGLFGLGLIGLGALRRRRAA